MRQALVDPVVERRARRSPSASRARRAGRSFGASPYTLFVDMKTNGDSGPAAVAASSRLSVPSGVDLEVVEGSRAARSCDGWAAQWTMSCGRASRTTTRHAVAVADVEVVMREVPRRVARDARRFPSCRRPSPKKSRACCCRCRGRPAALVEVRHELGADQPARPCDECHGHDEGLYRRAEGGIDRVRRVSVVVNGQVLMGVSRSVGHGRRLRRRCRQPRARPRRSRTRRARPSGVAAPGPHRSRARSASAAAVGCAC